MATKNQTKWTIYGSTGMGEFKLAIVMSKGNAIAVAELFKNSYVNVRIV